MELQPYLQDDLFHLLQKRDDRVAAVFLHGDDRVVGPTVFRPLGENAVQRVADERADSSVGNFRAEFAGKRAHETSARVYEK